MARSTSGLRSAATPTAGDIDAEVGRIGSLGIDALRTLWRKRRGGEAPAALSKDLIARALVHWLQEESFGGLSPQVRRFLVAVGKNGTEPIRHLKVGSVIVREHQGVLQEVMVVADGFRWRGKTYSSLSTIALKITGTTWNGPRFFGLRGADKAEDLSDMPPKPGGPPSRSQSSVKSRPSRRGQNTAAARRGGDGMAEP